MRTSFPASIKRFLLRMLPSKSFDIFHFLGRQESASQDFHDEKSRFYKLLRRYNESSKTIVSAFNKFKASYPLLPIEIASGDIWPNEGPSISVKTHLKSTFSTIPVGLSIPTMKSISTCFLLIPVVGLQHTRTI
jgi:hypothetical protein